MATTADIILSDLEAKLIALAPSESLGAFDEFTPVYNLRELLTSESSRRFWVFIVSGPNRSQGRSRCADSIVISVWVRYSQDKESRDQMLRDAPAIRECMKASAGYTDLIGTPTTPTITYDLTSFGGEMTLLKLDQYQIEYHATGA